MSDTESELIQMAWGIIANAGGGDWEKETPEWREAAIRWREAFHEYGCRANSEPAVSDREALAAALKGWDDEEDPTCPCGSSDHAIHRAARERLAQMREERCTDCVAGYVNVVESEEVCPTCLGYARLYPSALVERIAHIVRLWGTDLNDAGVNGLVKEILDALNTEPL